MAQLIGLPDTRRVRRAYFFHSIAAAIRLMRQGKAATTANDNGALTVWIDRFGRYRCMAYRRMCTIDSQIFKSQSAVAQWLKKWMAEIA